MKNRCRAATIALLLLILAASPLFAQEAAPEKKPILEAGLSLSPSLALFSRFFILSANVADGSFFLRWFDVLETSVHLHALLGEDLTGPPLVGMEAALAPRLGNYRPALGLGLLFASVDTFYLNLDVPDGEVSLYGLCQPLRWAWPMTAGAVDPGVGFLWLSFLELRFGSILPLGTPPKYENLGNFYVSVVFVAAGFSLTIFHE
jgi:hypothetical protein